MIEILQAIIPFLITILLFTAFARLFYLNHKSKYGIFSNYRLEKYLDYEEENNPKLKEFLNDWKTMDIEKMCKKYDI